MTYGLNIAFSNEDLRRGFMIASSALVDILLLGQLIRFSVYGKSWRFPLAVVMNYILSYLF